MFGKPVMAIERSTYLIDEEGINIKAFGKVKPKDKNRFIAGIECDGETYRMARTSRDRDDLRPRVLSGLGWKTYHVWSAEWTKNLSAEKKSLKKKKKKVEKENGESVL